ncbi:MAG: methyl-accepting chemotaxis protein [Tepidiformaceae bacterium]
MTWFNDLSIRTKLLASFAVAIGLMAVATVFAIRAASSTSGNTTELYNVHFQSLVVLDDAKQEFLLSNVDTMDALLTGDATEAKADVASAEAHQDEAKAKLEEYLTIQQEPEARAIIEKAIKGTDSLIGIRKDLFTLVLAGNIEKAIDLNQNGANGQPSDMKASQDVVALLNEATRASESFAADVEASAASSASSAIRNSIVIGLFAAVVGFGLALFISQAIRKSVSTVVNRLESIEANCITNLQRGMLALADGDLTIDVQPETAKIPSHNKDEVGAAAATINIVLDKLVATIATYNDARSNLSAIVNEVRGGAGSLLDSSETLKDSSDQMASATGQIANAINEVTRSAVALAGVSQESAREVEQVASGSVQLASAAKTNADSADESKAEATRMQERIQYVAAASEKVAVSAEDSRAAAQQGQEAVVRAVASMEAIAQAVDRASATVGQLGEFGQQIGDIVKTIDEIAAQTNLLALNAAIEAARAGEQGRGFAVVAENVRSLAERSSDSTKEIATLISKVQAATREAVEVMAVGVRDVEEGREITAGAGQALESIITSVRESAVQMQQIAKDVQDLSGGATRIVMSADQIAASAVESAEAANSMATGTSRVTEAIIQVSATSEETSASAEEVSASTEELSAQSQELAATASQVKAVAEGLNGSVARFKTAA